MKTVRIVLWVLVVVVGAAVGGVYVGKTFFAPDGAGPSGGVSAALARSQYDGAGGPFSLLDTDGRTVTADDLHGKALALFFGFTHCPDVCPTTLFDAVGWLNALGEDADKLQVAFISVDPERDTPDILKEYVGAFDPRIMGLTAKSEDEIKDVAERYKIRYQKIPFKNGDYTMNHTADVLLFDKNGAFAGFIPFLPQNIRQDEDVAKKQQARTVEMLRELART